MDTTLTKRNTKELIGVTTDVELADFFGITKQAVSRWPDDKPIPRLRFLELKEKLREQAKAA